MIRSRELKLEREKYLQKIRNAKSFDELRMINEESMKVEMRFIGEGISTIDLHFFVSSLRDEITRKTIELVMEDMKSEDLEIPKEKFSWIAVGSEGREEQTLFTDQDNAMIYEDPTREDVHEFFKEFASRVVDRLGYIGFKKCRGKVMASEDRWRGSISEWMQRIENVFSEDAELSDTLLFTTIMLDARHIAGERRLTDILRERMFKAIREHFLTVRYLAYDAGNKPVGINMFGRFAVEKKGEHKGMLNIKAKGCRPLVTNIRILAIAHGIHETNTIKRIWKLREKGVIGEKFAKELEEAYNVLTMTRILNHIRGLRKGYEPDDYIDPKEFDEKWQKKLKKALKSVVKLEAVISSEFDVSELF